MIEKKKFSFLTLEDRIILYEGRKKGYSARQLAAKISKSPMTVLREFKRTSHIKNCTPEQADEIANKVRIKKNSNLHDHHTTIQSRLTNLEFQVEILSDTIKEILKNGKN
jgi:IS30 family transposase